MAVEKPAGKSKNRSTALQSVRTKIVGAMVLAMVILSVCLSIVLIRNLRIPLMNLNKDYLYDMAVTYGEKLETAMEMQGYNTATNYSNLSDSLGNVGLNGVESSYVYLVSEDGTMLYYPAKDKAARLWKTRRI